MGNLSSLNDLFEILYSPRYDGLASRANERYQSGVAGLQECATRHARFSSHIQAMPADPRCELLARVLVCAAMLHDRIGDDTIPLETEFADQVAH